MDNSNLTERLATLSPAKRALLELKLKLSLAGHAAKLTIPRRADRDAAPLSFAQQRLWFLNQLEPESNAYNEKSVLRLDGPLNISALRASLSAIVERHEVLRTTFHLTDNGEPVQRIGAASDIDLPVIDISDIAVNLQAEEIQRIAAALSGRPFDLSQEAPLRLALIRMSPSCHVLVEVRHHIASDGWSSGVFKRELTALYASFAKGLANPLSELPIQYADYAVWQRAWLQGEVLEKQLDYWRAQLRNLPIVVLPTDGPSSGSSNQRGARQFFTLPKPLVHELRLLSTQEGATLFMTLLAAFQVLLQRYTGQDDIVVGSPIAGRTCPETEVLIGFFVNMLVLRTELSGNPTFRELLARVRETALQAYAHQDIPFEKLVEELNPWRDKGQTPLFQVAFAVQNAPRAQLAMPGLTVTPVELGSHSAKFDIFAAFIETEGESVLRIEYRAERFEAATVARLFEHYRRLLEAIVENRNRPIWDLPMLGADERHRLLVEWNDTGREYPSDKSIHRLFEEQVDRTPEATAVVFEDRQLSYRELNRRANQLAHSLKRFGVGRDVLVGICIERSVEMVVAMIGVLKAGGAYVPMDPKYPRDRLEFMLGDTSAPVLLTHENNLDSLPPFGGKIVCLDHHWDQFVGESALNIDDHGAADDLAYVIYTSGSTGKPKGVMIEHRNTVAFLSWAHTAFTKSDFAGVLASTSMCFDLSIFELFAPLTWGGCVILVENAFTLGEQDFSIEPTLVNTVPSVMAEVLRFKKMPPSIRTANLAGELLKTSLVKAIYEETAVRQVYDLYGPSETTTYSTSARRTATGIQTIGRPIANTKIYILDSHLNPVPLGVAGELYIGGAGLARGYLNQPELTAEKFIANPFSTDPQARLYKTGDRARYLSDGNIEFLGRMDNQVKIRGYRIELGEIESVLAQHPAIQQAVVLAREDKPGDKRLVAYVVAPSDTSPNELRSFLKHKLPEYMVPAVFVFLNEIPLSPNGKADRKALPEPDQSRPELDQGFAAPRTPVEVILAKVWAGVLKLDKVGIHDNFFELGGHSLLATQVMARIRGALSVELPLRRLFEWPTIHGLAKVVSAERRTPQTRRLPPIRPANRGGDLPLSFAQQRLWFIDQLEPESSAYNVSGAWRLSGPLDFIALQRSVNEIVRRHEVLRTSFVTVDGQPAQNIRGSVTLSLDLIHLAGLGDSERESAIRLHVTEEFQKPFDLAREVLLRAKLLKLAEDDHVLLLTMHHIVTDGWSLGVLFRELSRLYEAFAGGQASPLEDLPIQYADYAVWQRGWLQGDVLEAQLAYWRRQLENLTVLQLPTDRKRPKVQRYRGAKARVNFDAILTKNLWALSRAENATLYITLLAAFQLLLSRYSGQEDIAVGSPIAGRSTLELEELIGFFANTLVLRGDLSNNPTFREFLRRMRDVALEGYAHQDLPFEKLVEDLSPRRDLNISPLFQVMLVLQNDPREDLELKGLSVRSVSVNSETAKFDLLLSLRENKLGLVGSLEYDTDLFDASTIDRMLSHFEQLLTGIVTNPDQRLLQIPLLTDAELYQLLKQWNETSRPYPSALCVHQLFEKQAERSADRIAVVFDDRQLTYRDLDLRSNQLAHYLRKNGVETESLVGVCLERSPEMIVALLAVLKAGGGYLPLDPTYPRERLRLLLEQAGTSTVLTQESLLSQIPPGKWMCHCLDSLDPLLAQEKQKSSGNIASPANTAYALFTSGSTSVPKGVLMEHRPLVNLLSWQSENFVSHAGARTLQFAPLSFDVSFQEIFSTLCSGGTLVMIGEVERRDPKLLLRVLKEKAVERIFLPFVALHQLAEAAQNDETAGESLREIITAGEQLQATRPIVELFARLPKCRLHNQYGPTESHVVTSFSLAIEPADWPNLPPIGRPIANSKIYILDKFLQPVPVGVCGELFIGGDSLARGYLNQPELSQEKFIANPFINAPGARLYRTGDVACYLADGNIQFVGRMDDQVKVRGFRIEPGEIETLLCRHADVLECVVSVCEDDSGGKQLVAYIVTRATQDVNSGQLRDFLKEKLPEYMIPNVFVPLDSLPRTGSGKINRRALPEPDGNRPDLTEVYAAPRTPVEEILANVWAGVLKLDKVGIYDNFFDLGGHSLLATQVVSRIREVFRIELALRALFEMPTVASLSDHIESIRWAADENQPTSKESLDQTEEVIL